MSEAKIKEALRETFKFDTFKSELQEAAILEIAKRKHDVLVSMPTGSGKSLCYQLPAVVFPDKVTLVFSPLLALIKDQIDHLVALKVKAVSLNSKTLQAERTAILTDLKTKSPSTQLLYITPEQAATTTFKDLFNNMVKHDKVAFIVIDEAHCVSQWGHDFRPDYLKLGELRQNCKVPYVALTATAGTEVMKDIASSLKLSPEYKTFRSSCFRSNLFYDVYHQNTLEQPYNHLKKFIQSCLRCDEDTPKEDRPCGIVYCRTRDETEALSYNLNQLGVKAICYHAGLKNKERLEFQESWQNGEVPVICATVSFGMGVDKATVRFVVHWGVPKDPAAFYQESGRAGRDGLPAKCRVYYNRADRKAVEFLLSHELAKSKNKEGRKLKAQNAIKAFTKIVEFCESARECRHKLFSNHFGEPPPPCNKQCDVCTNKKEVEERVHNFFMRNIQFSTQGGGGAMDFSDLYGGGRKGISDETNDYSSGDSGSGFEREQNARKETSELIRKQFALRKNSQEVSNETINKLFEKNSRVTAAASTSGKVSGLNLATREQYLTKITEELYENYVSCTPEPICDKKDMEDCAVDLEYSSFAATTTLTMYRNINAKLIANIRKSTNSSNLYEALLDFEPKPCKNETLTDLFRSIKKEQALKKEAEESNDKKRSRTEFDGFRSASEMLKKPKLDKNQTTLHSFFKKEESEVKTESEENEFSDGESTVKEESNPENDVKSEHELNEESEDIEKNEDGDVVPESSTSEDNRDKKNHLKNLFGDDEFEEPPEKKEFKPASDFFSFRISTDGKKTLETSAVVKDFKKHSESSSHKDKYTKRPREPEESSHKKQKHHHHSRTSEKHKIEERKNKDEHRKKEDEHRRKEDEYRKKEDEHRRKDEEYRRKEDEHRRKEDEHRREDEHKKKEDEHKRREDEQKRREDEHKRREDEHKRREDEHRKEEEKPKEKKNESVLKPRDEAKPKENTRPKPKENLKSKKTEIGLLVVKLLTPAYAERRFDSRDTFKNTARNISHAVIHKDEVEIKQFVKNFLKNNEKITSSTIV